jgi:uncharacterized protein (DUF1800 family)
MAVDSKADAARALHRFGFGPRGNAISEIAGDPRGAVLADLERPDAGRIVNPDLPSSAQAAREAFDFRAERRARGITAKKEAERRKEMSGPDQKPGDHQTNGQAAGTNVGVNRVQQIFLTEAKARIDNAVGAKVGYVERLVWFWSNHFCVAASAVPAICGPYEREAIRPNVLGRFSDMLLAVESHPAMLNYLSNATSIGPNSIAGINRSRGLNENLGREILELHTLGVRTGYTQDDVTRFAYVLTGWTIVPIAYDPEHGGEFVFNSRMHEPGPQTVFGKTYPADGVEQGRAVLTDLARHPATAEHVALKLARHFVADQPPPALTDRLMKSFRDTEGDLKELAKALVTSPEAWDAPAQKLKRPAEWIVSSLRAVDVEPDDIRRINQAQVLLGEPLWNPPAPTGFSDDNAAWLDGVAQRIDIANAFVQRLSPSIDAAAIADRALGPLASAETRRSMAGAPSRPQALVVLLMAPEFQRR